jgi:hypothetical protein
MTITVIEDLIEGSGLSQSADGYVATRVFMATTTAQETKLEVLLHEDIPQRGDIHPDFDGISLVPIIALDRNCDHEQGDPAVFRVTIDYRRPSTTDAEPSEEEEDAIVHIGSSVTSSKTEVDKDGVQIVVTLSTATPTTQTGSVDIQVPETTIGFRRKESSNPGAKSIATTGKVNSASLGSGTYAARTLLCLGIEGESTDGGETYDVTYSFQYRPGTWKAAVVYIDPETDRPHADVDIAGLDGVTYPNIYSEVAFASLNLPWPT